MPSPEDVQYRKGELDRAEWDHPDSFVMKIKDPRLEYAGTKWLRVTREEFDAIKRILTGG